MVKTKKILSAVLALIMVLGVISFAGMTAFAEAGKAQNNDIVLVLDASSEMTSKNVSPETNKIVLDNVSCTIAELETLLG